MAKEVKIEVGPLPETAAPKKELKKFMRVSAADASIVEEVEELDTASFLAKLDQSDLDDDAEIARRNANKEATAVKRLTVKK